MPPDTLSNCESLSVAETAKLFSRSPAWVHERLSDFRLREAPGRQGGRRIQISAASIRVELARQEAKSNGEAKSNRPPYLRLVVDNA